MGFGSVLSAAVKVVNKIPGASKVTAQLTGKLDDLLKTPFGRALKAQLETGPLGKMIKVLNWPSKKVGELMTRVLAKVGVPEKVAKFLGPAVGMYTVGPFTLATKAGAALGDSSAKAAQKPQDLQQLAAQYGIPLQPMPASPAV